jgi:hypothetical protein
LQAFEGEVGRLLISHFHPTISGLSMPCSFCATGRLHDGRCRLDLRASAALVAFSFLLAMQLTVLEDFKQISDFRNMATNAL